MSASGRSRPPGQSFPKSLRLLRRRDFLEVQRSGTGFRTRHYVVVVRIPVPNVHGRGPRLGIVASKRVGNAVARNRGKRLVREWFRRLETAPPVDVVVILREGAPSVSVDEAWRELDKGLREAHRRAARPPEASRRRARRRPSTPDGGSSSPKR